VKPLVCDDFTLNTQRIRRYGGNESTPENPQKLLMKFNFFIKLSSRAVSLTLRNKK
jgi:hypothetical protein